MCRVPRESEWVSVCTLSTACWSAEVASGPRRCAYDSNLLHAPVATALAPLRCILGLRCT